MALLFLLMFSNMKQRKNHTSGNRQDSLVLLLPNIASELVIISIITDTTQHQLVTTNLLNMIISLLPITNPLVLLRH